MDYYQWVAVFLGTLVIMGFVVLFWLVNSKQSKNGSSEMVRVDNTNQDAAMTYHLALSQGVSPVAAMAMYRAKLDNSRNNIFGDHGTAYQPPNKDIKISSLARDINNGKRRDKKGRWTKNNSVLI